MHAQKYNNTMVRFCSMLFKQHMVCLTDGLSFYCLTLFDQGKFMMAINVKVNNNVV